MHHRFGRQRLVSSLRRGGLSNIHVIFVMTRHELAARDPVQNRVHDWPMLRGFFPLFAMKGLFGTASRHGR